ncbi:MAG: T9SS type A sorting domain-containing protein [Flavobacteriales bacterium]|nr:T9SS type A sorting domain-containing protein [Flavobacteriales bacterium]
MNIYNISGQLVNTILIPANTKTVNVSSSIKAGNYIYQLSGNKTVRKGKIIISQ